MSPARSLDRLQKEEAWRLAANLQAFRGNAMCLLPIGRTCRTPAMTADEMVALAARFRAIGAARLTTPDFTVDFFPAEQPQAAETTPEDDLFWSAPQLVKRQAQQTDPES